MPESGQPPLPLQAAGDVAGDEERGHLAGVQVIEVLVEQLRGEARGTQREGGTRMSLTADKRERRGGACVEYRW